MASIVFFSAALPLTKKIVGDVTEAYPHVSKLTSHHEAFESIQDLYQLLIKHAALGHCLFNGALKKPLVKESRAGKTLKGTQRNWVVLDFDKVPYENVDDLLPPECREVSHIVQLSSSMYRQTELFSGHIFFVLKEPADEARIKSWFEYVNFQMNFDFALTGSGVGLHWPLDRSAAFDSKLIYIAPPTIRSFIPTLKPADAIYLVKRKKPSLSLPNFSPVSKSQIDDVIKKLRTEQGMPDREFRTRKFEDGEIMVEAEASVIHGVKAIGDHYIKFNIGTGDSLGYWIDLRNPYVIKNFKDEPWLETKQIDEKFFKHLVKIAPKITARPPSEEGMEVFSVFATNREAQVYTGFYKPQDRTLRLDISNLTAQGAWLAEYGIIQGGPPRHVDIVFDPTSDAPQYVADYPLINTFRATDYMLMAAKSNKPSTLADMPLLFDRTVRSMLGDPDTELLSTFINWFAHIFQTREKIGISWVLSGVEGTGKGTFVAHYLTPLFGPELVRSVQFQLVQTQFNEYLEKALFIVFEEASTDAVNNSADLMAKLKHWITDSPLEIHAKNKNPVQRANYTNFIFNSNERKPVIVGEGNRRFQIANRQEKKINYTPNEYMSIKAGDELGAVADMLKRWPVNEAALRRLVVTETASLMHAQTTSINAQVGEAIRNGNIEFFIDNMPSDFESNADFGNRLSPLAFYKQLIDDIVTRKKSVLSEQDLYVLFRTLIPQQNFFQDAPMWRRRHYASHGLHLKNHYDSSAKITLKGVLVPWKLGKGLKRLAPEPVEDKKVVNIKRTKR